MHIDKDLVAASATPLVLGILAEEESYGYAIAKRVAELSGGHMEWTDGMLYPLLHRLERNGLVEAAWGRSETGRRRKHYAITTAGRDALVERQEQWEVVHAALSRAWESLADAARPVRGGVAAGPAVAGGIA
jgi:PadR family transcriptional regulator PadR